MDTMPLVVLAGGDAPTRLKLRFLLEADACKVDETAALGAVALLPRVGEAQLLVVIGDEQVDVRSALTSLRSVVRHARTVLLTRKRGHSTKEYAFSLGISEVIQLPIATSDLRVRLRRALGEPNAYSPVDPASPPGLVRVGTLALDLVARTVRDDDGWSAPLTRREAVLLHTLMCTPGQVVDQHTLQDRVWGASYQNSNALAVLVRRVRARLAQSTGHCHHEAIRTVHGRGYAFDAWPATDGATAAALESQVLIVDDDVASVAMVGEALRSAGYTVAHGESTDAPALAVHTRPSVVLLDINMPGMDGIEVRRRLRQNPHTASIPVIALSGGHNLRLRAREMDADDYLAKPFSIDELLLRVERWAGPGSLPAIAPGYGDT